MFASIRGCLAGLKVSSGNHESNGKWRAGAFVNDVRDIEVALEYLKTHYGYSLDLIVGHSRGVVS